MESQVLLVGPLIFDTKKFTEKNKKIWGNAVEQTKQNPKNGGGLSEKNQEEIIIWRDQQHTNAFQGWTS